MTSRPHHGGDRVDDSERSGKAPNFELSTARDEIAALLTLAYRRMMHSRIPVARSRDVDPANLAISAGQSVHGVVE